MRMQNFGSLSSTNSDADAVPLAPRGRDAMLPADVNEISEDTSALAQSVRDQLARDIADIESATSALRRADPALESWTKPPAATSHKPRPVWLLIGVLWLSTVIVTAGAVVAIATFAG
jgi:hypothetical protein